MKKYILSIIILVFIYANVRGQVPNWSVNENSFQYTMTFVSFLNVNGTELSNTNDLIAAFVGGECRGVTNLIYIGSQDRYYAYLTVLANQDGESLSFKIYDSQNDNVVDVIGNKTFEVGEHYGDLFQAFSFANPALNNEAEIIEFNFQGVTPNDKIINGNQITFDLDNSIDRSALNMVFELSPGADLYQGTLLQSSGQNSLDFTNPVQIQVVSEDRSVASQWTITVNLSSGTVSFYKKDAVCYAGGVIKVLFDVNGELVTLSQNDVTLATQTIYNGEAQFNNLEVGIYKVKVGGNAKEITINLKQ